VLNIATIIWATGYRPGYSGSTYPCSTRTAALSTSAASRCPAAACVPRLPFAHSASSGMVHGLGRDARYVAAHIAALASDHQRTQGWPTEETSAQRTELPNEHLGYNSHPTPP
jgi:hypothetical protein